MTSRTQLIGHSPQLAQALVLASHVASSDMSVLISGETGTGKELVARRIHAESHHNKGPFVAVDCGALAADIAESELFGAGMGAYTGVHRARAGLVEVADHGTLFLDEICNLSPAVQAKLLRVLETRCSRRLGTTLWNAVDFRLISSSNVSLYALVSTGRFRRDLYFRLAALEIALPPLRERDGDILLLARHFTEEACRESGRESPEFTGEFVEAISSYDWPGNVRELRNAICRAVLFAKGTLTAEHLPPSCQAATLEAPDERMTSSLTQRSLKEAVRLQVQRFEKELIIAALRRSSGNKAQAARDLQIDYKTIHNKIREYDICTEKTVTSHGHGE